MALMFIRTVSRLALLAMFVSLSFSPTRAQSEHSQAMAAGRIAYNATDFAAAERQFLAAITAATTANQEASAYYAAGVAAQKLGKLADAKQRAEAVLKLRPDDAQAKGLLAEVSVPTTPVRSQSPPA